MPGTESAVAAVDEAFVRDFLERQFEAWHAHDPEKVLALMNDDIVYDDSAWPTTMRGHAEVRVFLDHLWRAFPDLRFELVEGPFLHPHESKASDCWRGSATHTGPIDPPGLAPTGKRLEIDKGMSFYEFRDGRLSRLSFVFDMADASRQLGLLPKPGSKAERALAAMQRLGTKVTRRGRA
jgi:steroid delta-isomerase-like uncharacterized protein